MRTIKLFYAILTGAFLLVLAACNKGEDDFFYKGEVLTVNLTGYNGSSEELEVKIDTVKFKYAVPPNEAINQSDAYLFSGNQATAKLTITEKSTGKLVLERELKKNERIATVNLFYMDGMVSELPKIPPVEEGKVKMIYMFRPTVTNYTGLLDIEAIKIDQLSGASEKIGRINNVKPNEFTTEPLTFSTFKTGIQVVNGVRQAWSLYLRIYKAGTNEYYTQGTRYTWHENSSSPGKAAASTASSTLYIVGEFPSSGTQMGFRTILTLK